MEIYFHSSIPLCAQLHILHTFGRCKLNMWVLTASSHILSIEYCILTASADSKAGSWAVREQLFRQNICLGSSYTRWFVTNQSWDPIRKNSINEEEKNRKFSAMLEKMMIQKIISFVSEQEPSLTCVIHPVFWFSGFPIFPSNCCYQWIETVLVFDTVLFILDHLFSS